MEPDGWTRGACVGFGVHSRVALQLLRSGSGPPLDVGIVDDDEFPIPSGTPLATWEPTAQNPFHGRLYEATDGYAFWTSDAGWYRVDPVRPAIDVPASAAPLRREVRLWGVPAALCLLAHGSLSIHAASVEIERRAVLLAGPGRHGKSTLAAALHHAGHRLLSEDTTAVRAEERPTALPGPALLRLRPDVAGHVHPEGVVLLAADEERRHLTLTAERRGDGSPVTIAAIALLRPADSGPSIVRRASSEALRDLWAVTFKLPTDESRATAFERLAAIVARVPVVDLRRPLRLEALPATVQAIEDLAAS